MKEWTNWHEAHKDKILIAPGIECWIWTAGRSFDKFYGRVRIKCSAGTRYSEYAHRAAYTEYFGEIAKSGVICHKCGVGLCVRPSHLYDGTPQTNGKDTADMLRTKGKLTYRQVFEIRRAYQNGERLQSIADRYKIAFGTVYPIVNGKSYKHAPFPENYTTGKRFRKPLEQEELQDIRKMLSEGFPQAKIAKKHKIAQSIVSRINTGSRHVQK